MKLVKNLRWAVIAAGILSGPALAATINCTLTPANSVITQGGTLQLAATCEGGALASITWKQGVTDLTGAIGVPLSGDTSKPIYYTTPAGAAGDFIFTVSGVPLNSTDTFGASSGARVLINATASAFGAATAPSSTTTPVDAQCGTAQGGAATSMPTNGAQCASGSKSALAIGGPSSFTWSCVSLTGGAETSCYALRGFTVTATAGANGSVSPSSQGVASGGTVSVSATPVTGYSAAISGCGGTQSGNNFTTGPVTANCTVTASFTNSPMAAACGSANTVATLTAPSTGLCSTGALLGSVASGTGQFTWTCDGPNNGTDASCAAPQQYTVTATLSGTGGTVNTPTSKPVTHGATTSFSVTAEGTNVASASGCGASVSGNTVSTGAVTGACAVTVTFGPLVTGISANGVTMPGTVKELTTALPFSTFPRYSAAPANGDEVFSFKMTLPLTGQSVRTLSATKQTAMVGQKRMTISEYRGDYNPAGKPTGCTAIGTEVTTITTVVNYPTASTTRYCHLTPGKTYWVSVSSRFDKDNATTCSTQGDCGFYFESN